MSEVPMDDRQQEVDKFLAAAAASLRLADPMLLASASLVWATITPGEGLKINEHFVGSRLARTISHLQAILQNTADYNLLPEITETIEKARDALLYSYAVMAGIIPPAGEEERPQWHREERPQWH